MPLTSVAGSLGLPIGGVFFLVAGLLKAVEPQAFLRHLNRLQLLPRPFLLPVGVAVVASQCSLGVALLLCLWPNRLLPLALGVTLLLAALGYWSTATGRTEDCGCYNGLLAVSPLQSLLLDGALCVLLAAAWIRQSPSADPDPWMIAVVGGTALLAGAFTVGSVRYAARRDRPLVELSPLRVGRAFKPRWLGNEFGYSVTSGEKVVVFLGTTCPHCRKWVRVLNLMHRTEHLPSVIGAVATTRSELEGYRCRVSAGFPLVALKPWRMARFTRGVTPTAVLVRDGFIREKWVGVLPASFARRLRAHLLDSARVAHVTTEAQDETRLLPTSAGLRSGPLSKPVARGRSSRGRQRLPESGAPGERSPGRGG